MGEFSDHNDQDFLGPLACILTQNINYRPQTPNQKKCYACYLCLFEFVLFYLNLVWRNIHHQMGSYEK